MVAGYAVGGGHILHMMCDLTVIAQITLRFLTLFVRFRSLRIMESLDRQDQRLGVSMLVMDPLKWFD